MCPLFLSFMPVTIFCVRWIRPMTLVWNMTGERGRCRPGFGSDGDVLTQRRRKEVRKRRGLPSMSSCEMSPTFSTPLTRPALLEQAEEGGVGATESICGILKRFVAPSRGWGEVAMKDTYLTRLIGRGYVVDKDQRRTKRRKGESDAIPKRAWRNRDESDRKAGKTHTWTSSTSLLTLSSARSMSSLLLMSHSTTVNLPPFPPVVDGEDDQAD